MRVWEPRCLVRRIKPCVMIKRSANPMLSASKPSAPAPREATCRADVAHKCSDYRPRGGGHRWGAFESIQLDEPGLTSWLLQRSVGLRTRWQHLPYGDQGIFVERSLFWLAPILPHLLPTHYEPYVLRNLVSAFQNPIRTSHRPPAAPGRRRPRPRQSCSIRPGLPASTGIQLGVRGNPYES